MFDSLLFYILYFIVLLNIGYAQLYSMCSKGRSCVLVKDEGLTSAFIIAHEVGHL